MAPFVIAVIGAALYAAGAVGASVVFGRLIDDVVLPVFDQGEEPSRSSVIWWAAAIIIIAFVRIIGVVMRRYFAGMNADRIALHYRVELGRAYVRLPMSFHRRRAPGDLLAHVDSDSEVLVRSLHPLPFSIAVVFMAIFAAIAMFVVDWVVAIVALGIFPALTFFNQIYSRYAEEPARNEQDSIGRVSAVAHESFSGALLVKLLGRRDAEVERFSQAAATLRTHRMRVGDLKAIFESTLDAFPNLGIIIVTAVGLWRADQGLVTVGELLQVAALFAALALPMRVFGYFLGNVPPAMAAQGRLDSVLSEPRPSVGATRQLPDGPVDLTVRGLSVGYGEDTVIADVDLEIHAGETVALVGATGSGKSTLVEAMAGLLEPKAGEIRLGNVTIDDLDPAQRADAVRFAFQEAFLFAETIEANVGLDRPSVSAVDRNAALETSQATKFVGELPQGPSTVVGERGMTLSGGQRQRVALARALAGSPRLVVIDDAFSAVDPAVERQILDGLRLAPESPAILIVAHRLSTIRLADRVVYFKGGTVVARGTHDELLARDDYRALASAYEQADEVSP